MEIDGQVTISLKTFNQLQDRAKQADELKKRMRDLQEEITDIIDQIDETEAEPIFREIDDSNMTDKQIQKGSMKRLRSLGSFWIRRRQSV